MENETARVVSFARIQKGEILSLLVSGNGKNLYSSCSEGMVVLYDLERKVCVKKISLSGKVARRLALTPDGKKLIAGFADATVGLLNPETGESEAQLPPAGGAPSGAQLQAMVMSPDGRFVFIGCSDGTIRSWDLATLHPPKIWKYQSECLSLAMFPEGKRLFLGGTERSVLDASTGRSLVRLGGRLNLSPARSALVHPDGNHVFSHHPSVPDREFAKDGADNIRMWYVKAEKTEKGLTLKHHFDSRLALSSDGRYLCWSGEEPGIGIWDPQKNTRFPNLGTEPATDLMVHFDTVYWGTAKGGIASAKLPVPLGAKLATPTRRWLFEKNDWDSSLSVACDQCFTQIPVDPKHVGQTVPCGYCHRQIALSTIVCDGRQRPAH